MKYELDLYDKWSEGKAEGVREGMVVGIQQGLAQGREEGIREIIYSAFQQGLSTEVIASLTHMSIEEIEKLRETVPCRDA